MLACLICSWAFEEGKFRTIPYPTKHGNTFKHKPERIVFCENCGAGIALPLVSNEELEKFYAQGDYWGDPRAKVLSPKEYPVACALARSRWSLVESFLERTKNSVSILDIGAGHGFFGMEAAKSRNFCLERYVCVEHDKVLSESLRKTWSANFPAHVLETGSDIDLVDEKFDCIVFSHVLEHQTNPRGLFESALERLVPGGFVFIDVPNQDYLFKDDVFPHLLFFNTPSLRFLLESKGLRVLHLGCYGHSMNRSHLNYRNRSKARRLAIEMITTLRAVIPETVFLSFFAWYFGVNNENCHGTWIRAIAQDSGKRDSSAMVDQGQQS